MAEQPGVPEYEDPADELIRLTLQQMKEAKGGPDPQQQLMNLITRKSLETQLYEYCQVFWDEVGERARDRWHLMELPVVTVSGCHWYVMRRQVHVTDDDLEGLAGG